ncbi:MAG: transcriptional regulator PpsR [Thiohalocapsa sp. PB-PSB1]|jgi:transcriptional regulator PpsR|nr:MAG: hypothetical protein N838_20270 [Thiohalocapsa sp. PB-PSB1]QQO56200.1 MAG: transcriptional regulator PpsR [Thiohalocapsa sp. PB-PSB1]HCS90463.1 transcriptional regulator PpsR [Chromatiaceae bacterium]
MIDPNSAEPDITLILDHAGVIQQAVAGPSIAGEAISDWIGQPWADTVRDHERSGIGRLVEHARRGGVSGIGQVAQRFPSGLVLPLEYTTVRLGDTGGLVAVGRQPHAVTQLQTRLLDAQHVLEQDYWKLRAVETRYRMLLDSAQDALLTLTPETLRIVEINPPAARLLGAASENAQDTRAIDLIALLADADRRTLNDIVMRAQKHGMSNGLLQHIGDRSGPWLVRASSIPSGPVPAPLQLRIVAAAEQPVPTQTADSAAFADLIERWPDGLVTIDREGILLNVNAAFVEMTQEGSRDSLIGQSLGQWLGRRATDLNLLSANVERFGRLQLFSTLIRGTLGSETEVELSAVGDRDEAPRQIAVLIRNIGWHASPTPATATLGTLVNAHAARVGEAPLRAVVDETIALVERHYIETALRKTAGNRTAAAQLLGLSRQSLHTKLRRYGLEHASPASANQPSRPSSSLDRSSLGERPAGLQSRRTAF